MRDDNDDGVEAFLTERVLIKLQYLHRSSWPSTWFVRRVENNKNIASKCCRRRKRSDPKGPATRKPPGCGRRRGLDDPGP